MKNVSHFHPLLRLVHWLMALMINAMLFIGVGMVSTVSSQHSSTSRAPWPRASSLRFSHWSFTGHTALPSVT